MAGPSVTFLAARRAAAACRAGLIPNRCRASNRSPTRCPQWEYQRSLAAAAFREEVSAEEKPAVVPGKSAVWLSAEIPEGLDAAERRDSTNLAEWDDHSRGRLVAAHPNRDRPAAVDDRSQDPRDRRDR